ncbi:hypothetical protein [Nonomuraea sp. B19D2]|uniref:hypothetical protein n=1 Tax=Nonomuraea sp. B19D2 TaxID=3159561 RepID=UPI0032DACE5B
MTSVIESNPVAALDPDFSAAHIFQDTAVAFDGARRTDIAIVTGGKDSVQTERRRLEYNRSQRPRGQSLSSERRPNAVTDASTAFQQKGVQTVSKVDGSEVGLAV